ncbi:MAG: DUF805 domain-containing protein [Spirochaetia bacterium]|jgi:uncharacterized membrane protein YhaH (DUF805 family)
MNWYVAVLKKYVVFRGRASRKEYWMFVLFTVIFGIVAAVLDNVLGIAIAGLSYGPIYIIYALATLLPSLAVTVRRLHDIEKSGGYIFVALIPIVGSIWLLVLVCTKGSVGTNAFGEDPIVPVVKADVKTET